MTDRGQPTDADAFRRLHRFPHGCGRDVRVVRDLDGRAIVVDAQPQAADLEVVAWGRYEVYVAPVSSGEPPEDRGLMVRRHLCKDRDRG